MNAISSKSAAQLHEDVPPGWYYDSIKTNFLQRFWHRRRFEEVSKMIEKVKGKVLDIGSCDGTFTKVILDNTKTSKLIGIDVVESSVEWANNHWKDKRLKFMLADAHNLPFKANFFEAVFALEVLEHVFDPVRVLKEAKRVMKKDAYAILLVPSDSLIFQVVWFLWSFYRGKIWKHTHIHTYKNDYLIALIYEEGFKLEEGKKFLLGMLHLVKVRKI